MDETNPITQIDFMQENIEVLQNQLAEKDAMIDWLAERVEGFCSHTPCSMCIYEDDRYDECPVNRIGWRKAAQEAVKKKGEKNESETKY